MIATLVGVAFSASSAFAAVTWYPPVTTFEDDNMEWFIDRDANGVVSVGDTLVSVLEVLVHLVILAVALLVLVGKS